MGDNLTLWDDTVSDEQMIEACQDAAIDGVILAIHLASVWLDRDILNSVACVNNIVVWRVWN
jgi:hypothetical protein